MTACGPLEAWLVFVAGSSSASGAGLAQGQESKGGRDRATGPIHPTPLETVITICISGVHLGFAEGGFRKQPSEARISCRTAGCFQHCPGEAH